MKRKLVLFLAFDLLLLAGAAVLILTEGEEAPRPIVPESPEVARRRYAPPPATDIVRPRPPSPEEVIEELRTRKIDIEERWLEARRNGDWDQVRQLSSRRSKIRLERLHSEKAIKAEDALDEPQERELPDFLSPETGPAEMATVLRLARQRRNAEQDFDPLPMTGPRGEAPMPSFGWPEP